MFIDHTVWCSIPACAQCIMPVFEGLLPPRHNEIVLNLLFELATWHAFARLRVHTDGTLDMFQASTKSLTAAVRRFIRDTCELYATQELPKETAARGRRTAALTAKQGSRSTKGKTSAAPKGKKLNLETYKYHALADYPETIRMFGTADNYNTQIVCSLLSLGLQLTRWVAGRTRASARQEVLFQDEQKQCNAPDRKAYEARGYHPVHRCQGPIKSQGSCTAASGNRRNSSHVAGGPPPCCRLRALTL